MTHWTTLISGQDYDLDGPGLYGQAQPDLRTIGLALAKINRYNGNTARPYSVAEHSYYVATLAISAGKCPITQWLCIMHDAHEMLIGDVTSPVKGAVNARSESCGLAKHYKAWSDFEYQVENKFLYGGQTPYLPAMSPGFYTPHFAECRHFDLAMLATERRDLLNYTPGKNRPWPVIDAPEDGSAPIQPTNKFALEPDELPHAGLHIDQDWKFWASTWTETAQALQKKFLNHLATLASFSETAPTANTA
jgi:hypothetical protein